MSKFKSSRPFQNGIKPMHVGLLVLFLVIRSIMGSDSTAASTTAAPNHPTVASSISPVVHGKSNDHTAGGEPHAEPEHHGGSGHGKQ